MPEYSDCVRFRGNRLTNVYQRIRADQADEVIALWRKAGVVAPAEAARRCHEVVFTFHSANDELIGVNTVYVADFSKRNEPYYFYRTFIREADRGVGGLARLALALTHDFLGSYRHPQRPAGLVIVTENPKLMRPGVRDVLHQLGFQRAGQDTRGSDVWYRNFDGARLDASMSYPDGKS